jgi:hypothetical protein
MRTFQPIVGMRGSDMFPEQEALPDCLSNSWCILRIPIYSAGRYDFIRHPIPILGGTLQIWV